MVAAVCHDEARQAREPRKCRWSQARLFGDHPEARRALDGVLGRLALAGSTEPKTQIRSHHFVRTMRGMWACCNPDCRDTAGPSDASGQGSAPTRRWWALRGRPDLRTSADDVHGTAAPGFLSCCTATNVAMSVLAVTSTGWTRWQSRRSSCQVRLRRRPSRILSWCSGAWDEYAGSDLASSRTCRNPDTAGGLTFAFHPAALDPGTGHLGLDPEEPNGVVVELTGELPDNAKAPALPHRCPRAISGVQPRRRRSGSRGGRSVPHPCAHRRCVSSHRGVPGRDDAPDGSQSGRPQDACVHRQPRRCREDGCWRGCEPPQRPAARHGAQRIGREQLLPWTCSGDWWPTSPWMPVTSRGRTRRKPAPDLYDALLKERVFTQEGMPVPAAAKTIIAAPRRTGAERLAARGPRCSSMWRSAWLLWA